MCHPSWYSLLWVTDTVSSSSVMREITFETPSNSCRNIPYKLTDTTLKTVLIKHNLFANDSHNFRTHARDMPCIQGGNSLRLDGWAFVVISLIFTCRVLRGNLTWNLWRWHWFLLWDAYTYWKEVSSVYKTMIIILYDVFKKIIRRSCFFGGKGYLAGTWGV